ncbi:MAG: hypothetical protein V4796_28900 [Burkholderia cenocepacia]
MDDIKHPNDFPPLTIEQICDLAEAVREDFGPGLSWARFDDKLAMLLEDILGFEAAQVDARLIESAWTIYIGPRSNLEASTRAPVQLPFHR